MSAQPQDNLSMEPDLEHDIRNLVYHLWQTAGRDFGQTALEFWLAAESRFLESQGGHRHRRPERRAVLGGFLFGVLGLAAGGLIGSLVTAVIGAVVLLFLINLIKKA